MSGQSDHMRRGKKRKQRQQKPNKSNLESNNGFIVNINKGEKQRIEEWVKLKQDSETGGDLFGLWIDHHTAVVQFVLGPGEKCKRTKTSFFQDTNYLEQAGGYLTTQHGLCNIGQWHSHHKLALSEPSAGDHNTVWSNMPRTGLAKFIVFIANILPHSKVTVSVNCFLFEIKNGQQLPVKQGCLEELPEESPFRLHELVLQRINNGAESLNDKDIEDKSTRKRKPKKKSNKRSPVQNGDSNANESRASLMTSEGTPVKDNNMTNQEIAVQSNLNVQNNIDSITRKKCATTASAERSLLTIIGQKNGYFSFDTTNTNNGLQQQQQQQQNQRDENKQRLKSVEEVQQQQQNQGHKENGQKLEEKQMQQQQDNKQEWQAPQEEQMQQQQLQQKQENNKQEEEQGKEPQRHTEKRGKKGGKKRSKNKKKRTKKGDKDNKSSENIPSNEQPNGIWAYLPCILL